MHANPRPTERRGFLDEITGRNPSEKIEAKRPHPKAYEAARPFSQEGLMLEVCFANGRCRFLDTAGCPDAAYEPGDAILALFTTAVLYIEGRNLGELATLIKQRRLDYVQERHDRDGEDAESYIDRISLHSPEQWNELLAELEREGRIQAKEPEREQGHA